ncbi:PTS sugar transporter subunit IIA [Loigolactobacillus binensis]|uniref:PTS glucose transporter subunit IIA n=1 Tax=Loigolactobacillus binensis TaxID=2559922 RepID=A0ABW3EC44_9LACO|nr:PTS glucose transporter subunit IIA [Loigolactobacillus binensis]
MSLFLLTKKTKFFAPVSGELEALSEVADPTIASGNMGVGYAVEPTAGAVYSPVAGTVTSLFPTHHAIGLKVGALEILLYLGIDTAELNGLPFTIQVAVGDQVTPETQLATMDLQQIKAAGKATTVTVLIFNATDKLDSFKCSAAKPVTAGTLVGKGAER